jgi:acetylornithine deacetylase
MAAAAKIKQRGLRGDLILAAVADEEFESAGTEALVRRHRADGAIVGEPTNLGITTAHKGFIWLDIETRGVAAHGSDFATGIDAITKMGKVLTGLEALDASLRRAQPHPLLGSGSLHASLIEGGQELSSYPERCALRIERRTLPGETRDRVEAEIQGILDGIVQADPAFSASLRTTFVRHPMQIPGDHPLVQLLRRQAASTLGRRTEVAGSAFWTDAALLHEAGIPSVVFGPTGDGLHGAVEWVDIESVHQCFEIVLAAALEFCS